jgi:ubiquinone/menaquinone biosynthesis C-methylase UbiE
VGRGVIHAVTDWRDHPLCAPRTTMPDRFWGPEHLDPAAFRELVELLDPSAETAMLLALLEGMADVVDVGGGTGLLTRSIAERMPVTVVEPAEQQRAHLPAGIAAVVGRAEQLPLGDGEVDAAIATWVLQYTDDPMLAIDELARVARRRIVIVQAAPTNDLVDIYNREAAIAGHRPAHHGWLLAEAADRLAARGYLVVLDHVAIPVRVLPTLADTLARLHFAGHPKLGQMVAANESLIGGRTTLADDGAVLLARR